MSASDPSDASVFSRTRWKVCDFLSQQNIGLDSPDDRLAEDDTLIDGEFLHRELRNGLFLHLSNVREEHAFTLTSRIDEGLSCIFFLEGHIDLKVGSRRFSFGRRDIDVMEGTAIINARPDSFERRSHRAQDRRHLVVSASPEWLGVDLEGLHDAKECRRLTSLFKDHLRAHRWALTPRTVELLRQIASPTAFVPELHNLYLEGRAVEIVGETLAALMKRDPLGREEGLLARRDMMRLNRAKDFIMAHLASPLSVERVAREAGLNPNGLQHIFRSVEGMSIFEYVRRLRLERAAAALRSGECTVTEASLIAGYSSPTNFAAAFKRVFGHSPREFMPIRPVR